MSRKGEAGFCFTEEVDDDGSAYTMVYATGGFVVDDIPYRWQPGSTHRQSMMKIKAGHDTGPGMFWTTHEICENHWLRYGSICFIENCKGVCKGEFDPYVESFG